MHVLHAQNTVPVLPFFTYTSSLLPLTNMYLTPATTAPVPASDVGSPPMAAATVATSATCACGA